MKKAGLIVFFMLGSFLYAQKTMPEIAVILVVNDDTVYWKEAPKLLFWEQENPGNSYECVASRFRQDQVAGRRFNMLRLLTADIDLAVGTETGAVYFDRYFPAVYPVNKLIIRWYPRADAATWKRFMQGEPQPGPARDIILWNTAFSDETVVNTPLSKP